MICILIIGIFVHNYHLKSQDMKKAFILIISVFTVVSLMGQSMRKVENLKDLDQKSIKKVMEMFSPMGLNKDFKKHPEFAKYKQKNRSVKEMKQVLDSMDNIVDGIVYTKERYTYDLEGNWTLFELFFINEHYILTPAFRHEYTYNASGEMISNIYKEWDEDLNDWLVNIKIEYSYSNGLLSIGNLFNWDADINEWILSIKEEYSYDEQNRLTSVVSLTDYTGVWEKDYKEEVIYNADGYAYLWTDYHWNLSSNLWIPFTKEEDFFNTDGDVDVNIESDWNEMTSTWMEQFKIKYTYNSNHQIMAEIYSDFNEGTFLWEERRKDENSYDEHGNITNVTTKELDGATWVLLLKEELTFDYSTPIEEVVYPNEYFNYEFNHKLTNVNSYFWNGSWLDDEQFILYYSEKDINGIVDIIDSEINIYPNPNKGIFNIEINGFGQKFNVSVINFAGRVIEQEEVKIFANEFKSTLDLSKYSSGVYFLRISNDSKSDYKKIVIQ